MRRAWEHFWFRPEPTSTLALLQIAVGAVVIAWALLLAPDLQTFYGVDGVVPGTRAAPVLEAVLLLGGAALVVGYRTRLAAALVFVSLAWLHRVDPWAMHAGDGLLRDLVFVLAIAPGGARRAGGFPLRAPWAIRLVQLQVSVMYLAAVAAKLGGSTWRDGTAVSYPLRLPELTRFAPPEWLTGSVAGAHVLTWGTLATEAAIGLLVWSRRARPWVLALGVGLHLSIDVTLRAGLFSWIVLAAYVAFVPSERAERILLAARRTRGVIGSDFLDSAPRCRARIGSRRSAS